MSAGRVARGALALLTGAVALVSFAVSFHGLDGYGLHVMRIDWMSPAVPLGLDMASLVALLAAHLRRGDSLRRRAYAWTVFGVTGAMSVAGNVADGVARGLPAAGLVGAATAPFVFALVSHLAITSWRPERNATASAAVAEVSDADAPVGVVEVSAVPVETATTPPERAKRTRRPDSDSAVKVARTRLRHPNAKQPEVAQRTGLSLRTVSRHWAATEPATPPDPEPDPEPVNGMGVPELLPAGATR